MTKKAFIDQLYSELFEKSIAIQMRSTTLKKDGAKVIVTKSLSEDLLRKLFQKKILAIHVPGYFSKGISKKASRWILENSKIQNWPIPYNRIRNTETDMSYGIGFPLQQAIRSQKLSKKYIKEAIPNIHKVRKAFAPFLSPMDRLRLELEELWNPGTKIAHYQNRKGFVGLVRMMQVQQTFTGIASERGICHIDGAHDERLFSANLYVNIPPHGGALRIWDIALHSKLANDPLYKLIRSHDAFRSDIQEIIQHQLPLPKIIHPKSGDLVLFDVSRPHAVAGLKQGNRINIQSWVRVDEKSKKLIMYS